MIRIITDSAADFEPLELEQLQVTCIPLTVSVGDAEYRENETLTKDQFYRLLQETEQMPKTAQASPQILLDLLENACRCDDEAIYFTISSAISGTYQTAVAIKQMVGSDRCHVVDCRNATGGQRMLVEYAVRLREEGKSAAEIVAAVKAFRSRIVLFACMDTMQYLYLGGRISHTTYTLGTVANIKPIITVSKKGQVDVPAKMMGMRRGMAFLCKQVQACKPDEDFPLYVMYTSDRSVAKTLAERLAEQGVCVPEAHIIQVGAAIGSHVGPGACGLVYAAEE